MTNEEAVRKILNAMQYRKYWSMIHHNTLNYCIESIQENAKLKAENFQLKSELEQSVKLPCKVGDTIYKIPSDSNYKLNILNGTRWHNRVYCQVVNDIRFYPSGYLLTTCDGQDCVIETFFNVNWFLTLEEAERALKGRGKE